MTDFKKFNLLIMKLITMHLPQEESLFHILSKLAKSESPLHAVQMGEIRLRHVNLHQFLLAKKRHFTGPSIRKLLFIEDSGNSSVIEVPVELDTTLLHILFRCYEEYRGISFQELFLSVKCGVATITYRPLLGTVAKTALIQ